MLSPKQIKRLALAGALAAAPSAFAQITNTVTGDADVTSDSSTWIQVVSGNGIDIPAGANGVTINNGLGGQIQGDPNAIITAAQDTTINNAGNIAGVVNGINFTGPNSSGSINNAVTGNITSDSRAVDLSGVGISVVNEGNILGTGNQRNGTLYTNDTAADFNINNSGLIDAGVNNNGAGASISLSNDPTLTDNAVITNSGTIRGRSEGPGAPLAPIDPQAADGLRLEGVRNPETIFAPGVFTGTVTNSGLIESGDNVAGSTSGFHAVNGVSFQGTLTNEEGGIIRGAANGVYFGNPVATGGADHTGGVVNNFGTFSSDSRAFNLDGIGLTVNNSGDILGTASQRNGTFYADGTADDYTVNNLEGGVIDAGLNNEGSGFGAEIGGALDGANTFVLNNEGTIQGRGNASAASNAAGDGVRIGNVGNIGTAEVTFSNSGTIASEGANGTVAGVRFVNGISFAGTLDNSGTITGVQNGLYFGNPVNGEGADHSNGVVNNTGTISSQSRAFNLDGIGLTVNNSGDIVGLASQRNGTFYADGTADDYTVNNLEDGVIDAGENNEGSGFGAEIGGAEDGANTFVLNNAGTIQGRGNASAAVNAAGDGVRIGNVGNIGTAEVAFSNSGTIASEGANGTVAGVRFVNGISFAGTLDNSGTITGVQNGLYFGNPVNGEGADHSNGTVNNTGTISSQSRAFNLDGIGLTVNNSGEIIGLDNQRNGTFYADGTADDYIVNNLATGVIDAGEDNEGSGFGAEIGGAEDGANTFSLTNSGLIQGRGNASAASNAAGDGVRIGNVGNIGTAEVNLTNTGTINSEGANGTVAGIRFVNGISFSGVLNNAGEISGVQNGLYFGNPVNGEGADHSNGVVNNLAGGVIVSDSRAFNLDGIGLTVNNEGAIVGSGRQRNGTFYVDGTGTGFTINNLAGGSIDAAGAGGEGSGISIQVGIADGGVNTQTGAINNGGLIAGAGEQPIDAGIRLFAPEAGDVFQGNIINADGGLITAEGKTPAVLVEEGVVFDGTLINNGEIDGSIDLASGDVVLGSTSLVTLDIAGTEPGEFEFIAADSVTTGGILDLVFHTGFFPEVGDVIQVIDADEILGQFADVLNNVPGVLLDTSDLLIGGTVTVAAVPEPSTGLLLITLVSLAGVARRR